MSSCQRFFESLRILFNILPILSCFIQFFIIYIFWNPHISINNESILTIVTTASGSNREISLLWAIISAIFISIISTVRFVQIYLIYTHYGHFRDNWIIYNLITLILSYISGFGFGISLILCYIIQKEHFTTNIIFYISLTMFSIHCILHSFISTKQRVLESSYNNKLKSKLSTNCCGYYDIVWFQIMSGLITLILIIILCLKTLTIAYKFTNILEWILLFLYSLYILMYSVLFYQGPLNINELNANIGKGKYNNNPYPMVDYVELVIYEFLQMENINNDILTLISKYNGPIAVETDIFNKHKTGCAFLWSLQCQFCCQKHMNSNSQYNEYNDIVNSTAKQIEFTIHTTDDINDSISIPINQLSTTNTGTFHGNVSRQYSTDIDSVSIH